MVKNPPAYAGDVRNSSSIPGSGRFPGSGHGDPLQRSCLENPMDRGAWRCTVHRVTKSQTLKRLSTHTCTVKGGTPWKEERETEGWFREEPYFTTCLIQDFLGTMLLKNETKSCLSSPRGHQKCLTLNSLHLKKKKRASLRNQTSIGNRILFLKTEAL